MNLFNQEKYNLQKFDIDNYIFADHSMKEKLIKLGKTKLSGIDSLLFMSTEGNGGTFLMCSSLRLLTLNKMDYIMITGDYYSQIANMAVDEFIEICAPYSYIVFDNLEFGCSRPKQNKWLNNVFTLLRKEGKKTLSTITVMDTKDFFTPPFIKESRHEVFYSLSQPSIYPEIVKMILGHLEIPATEEVIKNLSSNITCSVRELEGICVCYAADKILEMNSLKSKTSL